ncbi:CaiB/BaiF CoA transferase family protein [Candidatus Raskinella chloraquaticus]|jgi:alpha-methylacyl-CoA racemase|uniref:Carnitine dehydratase n=1 Tax=Candidatus Raskinella chloraquaticus TaxID=1951219 RepID=A0A1W9HZR3_9HYPH|nr:MAG: hypothetical protein A4S15_06245 [Proteobacteria bacterium SG_bin8]
MTQPLSSLVVVDFTTLLPGPLATLMLARAGAKIIKIERPEGDEMRQFGPFVDGKSLPFELLNRGKICQTVDLKNPAETAKLRHLLASADIVVEQFRPGVMARLGLDYATLSALNPRLIYCSITGYGANGPLAHKAGHDLNYIAESGLLSLSRGGGDAPVLPPALIADIAGGSLPSVINILLALLQRDKTGRGTHLDIAMSQSTFALMPFALAEVLSGQSSPPSGAGMLTGGLARYNLYPTRDGRMLAIAALEDRFWRNVCAITDLEEQLRDDYATPAASHKRLRAIIASEDSDVWMARFAQSDCCVSLVHSVDEAISNPQFSALFDGKSILPLPIARHFSAGGDHG